MKSKSLRLDSMLKTKYELLNLGLVVDNEYLDKYISLFNSDVQIQSDTTMQKHHFIPIYYYKKLYHVGRKQAEVYASNDKNNIVKNVTMRTHILLHFYLEKCSTEKYRGKNIFSMYKLFGNKYSREDLYAILEDEQLLIEYINLLNGNYLFTEEHHQHLKDAIKNRKSSTNNNISKTGYVGGVTGLKMIYNLSGKRCYVSSDRIDELLQAGWTLPTNKKRTNTINNTMQPHTYTRRKSQDEVHKNLSRSHAGKTPANKGIPRSEETKHKLSNSIKGRIWINNGQERKQIKREDLDSYVKLGYVLGFVIKSKSRNNDNGGDLNEVN